MLRMPRCLCFFQVFAVVAACLNAESHADDRPNVLLIVADDMGFTDLGSFGSEIETPHLDAMARQGVRLTNFHAAPSCSPTRAMLMSGCDNHTAGIGAMVEQTAEEQKGKPGYEGHLNDRVATLPELLKDSGYHTYMAGKWHLGLTEELSPKARGFERSFALLLGGGSHFDMRGTTRGDQDEDKEDSEKPKSPREERKEQRVQQRQEERPAYREDNQGINTLPDNFYSSKYYADKLMQYIEEDRADGKPFFGWLAFTAPHWPLQAPDEFLAKYRGRYDNGFDVIREDRLQRMKQLGIISADYDTQLFMRSGAFWDQLSPEERAISARKMEAYSAMVDCMDHHIGRVVDYLKKTGQYENTYIIFMSDNGADAGDVDRPGMPFSDYVLNEADNSLQNMGRQNSFISKGRNWAQACTAPYKLWKGFTTEGGIRVPAVIYHPSMQRQGDIDSQLLTVMDVAPTILDLANAKHPGTQYKGKTVAPIQGKSFARVFQGQDLVHAPNEAIGWELHGRRAVFMGDYKATHYGRPFGSGQWELYDLKKDPGEINNLAQSRPNLMQTLATAWDRYSEDRGVVLIPDMPPGGGRGGQGGRAGQGGGGRNGQGGRQSGGRGPQMVQGNGTGRGSGGGQRQGGGPAGNPNGGNRPNAGGVQGAAGQQGAAGRRQPLVAALDANGDLEISDAEMRAASAALIALDVNGNGQLDGEEFRAQRNNTGGQGNVAGGRGGSGPNVEMAGADVGRRRAGVLESAGGSTGAQGRTLFVKAGGRGDGSSWNSATSDLNAALAQAQPGDEIHVAEGIYYPSANGDRSASFYLAEGVTVMGGYSGSANERDFEKYSTILSGDIGQPGDDTDNSYHVVIGARDAVLDGFTITGGNGTNAQRGGGRRGQGGPGAGPGQGGQRGGQGPGARGGQGNRGPQGPGNRQAPQASLAPVVDSGVMLVSTQQGPQGQPRQQGAGQARRQQRGPGQGGGGQGAGGPGGPGGPPGGGQQPIHITPQMLLGGINPGGGAGIVNFKCAPTYRNCIIRDNKSRKGAGAYNMVATTTPADPSFQVQPAPTFINCSFINNYAVARGGAVSNDLGTEPTFLQCTFQDNKCDGKGGAMYNDFRCSPTMKYCVFVGNSAYDGGALGNDGSSSPVITNCTFFGNHAIDMGAALYQGSGPANNPIVTNTIIWGNTCDNGPAGIVNWHDNSPVVTYSCVEGGYFGDGNFDVDPMFTDPAQGDFSLAANSPCIDKANGLAAPLKDRFNRDRYDDRGIPDGPISSIVAAMGDLGKTARQGTAPADIGALERQASTQTERLTTVYVNASNQGQQDGRSWKTAFNSIQPAIELAYRSKAEVWVTTGRYLPTAGGDRTVSIQLRDDVAIYGGFQGNESSKGQRDASENITLLSGDIGTSNESSDNSFHVLVGANGASLDGFVIAHGNANGQAYHAKGGGMINYARHKQKAPTGWATGLTVHLSNCVFMDNTATEGGAVYNYDRSNPTFRNVAFKNNSAESGGAIVDRVGVKSELTDCTFTGNYAKWRGGAVYFDYGSRPQITNCTFSDNKTDGHGGAGYIISRASQLENTIVAITNSRFDHNVARLKGGGIANADSGVLQMTSVQFADNMAGDGGGAVSNEYLSTTKAQDLQFSGNTSAKGEANVETDETSNAQISP